MRTYDADRNKRNAVLLRETEGAKFEFVHSAIARAFSFRENDEARATVDGVFGHAPHSFEVPRAAHVGHRHVSEALHEQAVNRNLKMRFEFPSAHELWNRAIEHERIEKIDMIGDEKRRLLRIKTGRNHRLYSRASEKHDAATKRS